MVACTRSSAKEDNRMSEVSRFLIPKGFQFGATIAGLKASGRADFALIVADAPASAAAAFTANKVSAAPLQIDKEHLRATGGKVRVVAINAGNANCAVGQAGLDAARATCVAAAHAFACTNGGGISVVHGNHWRSAACREGDCGAAGGQSCAGRRIGSFSRGGAGDSDHRHGGEDCLCADRRGTAARCGSRHFARVPA